MNGRKNVVGLAFAHHCILRQSSTLIVHLYFSSSLSFMFFWRPKERKAPAPAKHCLRRILAALVDKSSSKLGILLTGTRIHNSLLLTSRKRHPSVGCYLPQTAVRSSIGDKTTRFSRNNSIAYMHRSDIFYPVSDACPAVCCDFDGAGFSFILPLYTIFRELSF